MILQAESRYMEYLGEWIQIHNSQNDIIGDLMEYNIFSAENINNFSLQLVTDENVKGAGFNVREFQVDCTCASNLVIIPCTGKYYAPILQADWTESTKTHTFCRGMNCSYQFEVIDDCGDSKIEIDVDFQTPGLQFNDIVGVNVDGTEVWNSTEGNTFTGQFGQKQVVEFFFNSADYKYEFLNQIPVLLVGYSLVGQTSGSTMASPTMAPPTMASPTIAPPSPTTGTGCPANAIQSIHKNQCFFVITNGKTFNDAENDCKTYGGHLASIHSAFDNILIDSETEIAKMKKL
uniref:C-type lectin domain-containing protein n=1 Tax=Panagrolaimus sp. JU765 TaxID=591449 RepID=A0AC34QW11_9BILA